MNWTGGRLSRSRNVHASVLAKQKNHFAKVRAKLANSQSFTPTLKLFDFGHWQPEYEVTHSLQLESTNRHALPQHRAFLDDLEDVKPVVNNLASPKSRNGKRKHTPLLSLSRLPQPQHHRTTGRPQSPMIISSQASSASPPQSSPEAPGAKIRLPRFSSPHVPSQTSIEAKRRRLLQIHDWVGLERRHSRPAHMEFTDVRDRDLIGKRRQVKRPFNYLPDPSCQRTLKRKAYFEKSRRLASPDQYFGVSQMSIRIGSAADGSDRNAEKTDFASYPPPHSVRSEDMLFDIELAESSQPNPQPSLMRSTIKAGELGSLQLSNYRSREIRTPSALMKDSSSSTALSSHSEMQIVEERLPTCGVSITDGAVPDAEIEGSEWESPDTGAEQAQEPTRFKLMFEATPQTLTTSSEARSSSSLIRDFAFGSRKGPRPSGPIKANLKNHNSGQWIDHQIASDGSLVTLATNASPLTVSTPEILTGYSNRVSVGASPTKFGQGRVDRDNTAPKNRTPPSLKTKALSIANRDEVSQTQAESRGELQAAGEEEELLWRSFTSFDSVEDVASLNAQPGTSKSQVNNELPNAASNRQIKTAHQIIAAAAEEQIWRTFIFSDDDPNTEWTIEEPQCQAPALSPYNPAHTQPSMIAKVATSPTKQNPHLLETSDASRNESIIAPNRKFRRAERIGSSPFANNNSSTSLAEDSLATENSSELLEEAALSQQKASRVSPQVLEANPATRQAFHIEPWPLPPLPKSTAQKGYCNNPSSLNAEASSASVVQASSNPVNLSSDELQGPPPPSARADILARVKDAKVVFTPPRRYVGGQRAADLLQPLHLGGGRLLRNGKRLSEQVRKAGRKGNGQGRGLKAREAAKSGDDGDEIED